MGQPIPGDPEQAIPPGEQVFDDPRQREGGILKSQPNQFRVFIKERNDFAGLRGESALAGGQQIQVRQHDHPLLHRPANRRPQLGEHHPDKRGRPHPAALVVRPRPAVQKQAAKLMLLEPPADIDKQPRHQVLVTFHQHRQPAHQVARHIRQLGSISRLHRLIGREFLREIGFRNDDAHSHFDLGTTKHTKDTKKGRVACSRFCVSMLIQSDEHATQPLNLGPHEVRLTPFQSLGEYAANQFHLCHSP